MDTPMQHVGDTCDGRARCGRCRRVAFRPVLPVTADLSRARQRCHQARCRYLVARPARRRQLLRVAVGRGGRRRGCWGRRRRRSAQHTRHSAREVGAGVIRASRRAASDELRGAAAVEDTARVAVVAAAGRRRRCVGPPGVRLAPGFRAARRPASPLPRGWGLARGRRHDRASRYRGAVRLRHVDRHRLSRPLTGQSSVREQ